ncbi:hypothetical protein [uncultured Rubinisphaera sp.]|uniref:hypothetical protein n=1 Tax=uncultured Rubinisphaera sp. TaxID=1678686 RepID=UPI0030DC4B17
MMNNFPRETLNQDTTPTFSNQLRIGIAVKSEIRFELAIVTTFSTTPFYQSRNYQMFASLRESLATLLTLCLFVIICSDPVFAFQVQEIAADFQMQIDDRYTYTSYAVETKTRLTMWDKDFREDDPQSSRSVSWAESIEVGSDKPVTTNVTYFQIRGARLELASRHNRYRVIFVPEKGARSYNKPEWRTDLYEADKFVGTLFRKKISGQKNLFSSCEKWLLNLTSRRGDPRKLEPYIVYTIEIYNTQSGRLHASCTLDSDIYQVINLIDIAGDGDSVFLRVEGDKGQSRTHYIVRCRVSDGKPIWKFILDGESSTTDWDDDRIRYDSTTDHVYVLALRDVIHKIAGKSGELVRKQELTLGSGRLKFDVSPDGRFLAVVSREGTSFATLYDVKTLRPIAILDPAADDSIEFSHSTIAWAPDSRTLFSKRLCNVAAGKFLSIFRWTLPEACASGENQASGGPGGGTDAIIASEASESVPKVIAGVTTTKWNEGVGFGVSIDLPREHNISLESRDNPTVTAVRNDEANSYRVVFANGKGFLQVDTATRQFQQLLSTDGTEDDILPYRGFQKTSHTGSPVPTAYFLNADRNQAPSIISFDGRKFATNAVLALPCRGGYHGLFLNARDREVVRFRADEAMSITSLEPLDRLAMREMRDIAGWDTRRAAIGWTSSYVYGGYCLMIPEGVAFIKEDRSIFIPLPKGESTLIRGNAATYLYNKPGYNYGIVRMTSQGKLVILNQKQIATLDQNMTFSSSEFDRSLQFGESTRSFKSFYLLGDDRHAAVVLYDSKKRSSPCELHVFNIHTLEVVSRASIGDLSSGSKIMAANGTLILRKGSERGDSFFVWRFDGTGLEEIGRTLPTQHLIESAETWGISEDGALLLTLSEVRGDSEMREVLRIVPIRTLDYEFQQSESP